MLNKQLKKDNGRTFDNAKYNDFVANIKHYKHRHYTLDKDNKLFFNGKKVITIEESFDFLLNIHNRRSHGKENKIRRVINQTKPHGYYGITRTMIRIFLQTCVGCIEMKKPSRNQDLQPIVTSAPRERVLIDLINMNNFNKKFRNSNIKLFNFILTIIDHYSNHTIIYPQITKTKEETVKNVTSYIRIFGAPRILQSDNGPEFVNDLMDNLAKEYGIELVNSAPYHPQTNGKVEKCNNTIKNTLRGFMNTEENVYWTEFRDRVIEEINNSVSRPTHCKPINLFYNDIKELMNDNPKFRISDTNENSVTNDYIDMNNEVIEVSDGGGDSSIDGDNVVVDDDDGDDSHYDKHDEDKDEVIEVDEEYVKKNIIKNKKVIDKFNEYINERKERYNIKMKEDYNKKLKTKTINLEHGNIVYISEKKKNKVGESKFAIIKEDEKTKVKYAMYIYIV